MKLFFTLRELRPMPLFALSDNGDTAHKVEVFTHGASDFLQKPYDIEKCVIKAYSLLRRCIEPNYTIIKNQVLMIDAEYRKVLLSRLKIELTRKEFEMLFLLAPTRAGIY